jgi:catecholate siderophore receptor
MNLSGLPFPLSPILVHALDRRRLAYILATTALASQAGAQTTPPDSATRQAFDIPARPLSEALAEFARRTGLHVSARDVGKATARSSAVAGTASAAEALRTLLAGTGFEARFADAATVVIAPAGSGDGPHALRTMVVTGTAARGRGYATPRTTTATRTDTPLRDTPQSVSIVTRQLIADQSMQGMADVVRYVPGITMGQGEGHRDAPTIRGNSSTADFFVDGVRDDAQYLRDLYNVERVEALKGSNAMVFGRGGGGGVLNRVTKEAQWTPTRALTLEGGSFDHKRALLDAGRGFGTAFAGRVNGMYERSDAFRDATSLRRYGINPTATLLATPNTSLRLGYEYFDDARTVDRGIPSFRGAPSRGDISTFFGNPDVNRSTMHVHHGTATIEHATARGLTLRNRTRLADYDKFYQNTYPGAIDSTGTRVALSAYNHAIARRNAFNQTDVTLPIVTGPVTHTLLVGTEVGRQRTDQFRNTGYFNGTATSFSAPLGTPTVSTPVAFRQSATDADNGTRTTTASAYVQDQLALGAHVQAIAGLRYERFAVRFHDDRTSRDLRRDDRLVSPRAGLVVKPVAPVSIYGTFSRSYLPSAGDQFASLTVTSRTLEPERFTNRELGAKWDVGRSLSLTTALYRLDRTNTSAPDPTDPSRTLQTGAQRTTGYELGATGNVTAAWQLAGGFAAQRARIVSTTSAAKAGQSVALVPHRTVSLWNRYQIVPALGVGLGVVHQSAMYAAIDNTVTLPGFTRADAALFAPLGRGVRAQLNVENALDRRYYATSHGNDNIMPGAPRTVRLTIAVE